MHITLKTKLVKIPGITTIDLYIIKKFLGTFIYAIILIISISVVFDLTEKIDDFIEEETPLNEIVFDYYINFVPYFANLFVFLFTFIAVIFFTSKLSNQTEVIAILSSGISYQRMLRPYFISATIIAVFSFLLSGYFLPPANAKRTEFEMKYIKGEFRNTDRNIHRQVEPGVFIYFDSYTNRIKAGYKFSIEKFVDGQLVSKLIADMAKWDSISNKWSLKNYKIRNINGLSEEIIRGKTIDSTINMHPDDFDSKWNLYETMTNPELSKYIEQERVKGENVEVYEVELYRRYSAPLAIFVLTLIGVSLSSRKAKRGVGAHIGIGLLLSFTYILFMEIAAQFAISGSANPKIAILTPTIAYGVISIFLYRTAPK